MASFLMVSGARVIITRPVLGSDIDLVALPGNRGIIDCPGQQAEKFLVG